MADAACRRDALRIANAAVLMVLSTGAHRLIENKQRGVVSGILGISGDNHRRVIQNELSALVIHRNDHVIFRASVITHDH